VRESPLRPKRNHVPLDAEPERDQRQPGKDSMGMEMLRSRSRKADQNQDRKDWHPSDHRRDAPAHGLTLGTVERRTPVFRDVRTSARIVADETRLYK